MELNKTLYEFLIATLPAVVLYFVGWGYLFFLLGDFGINISEINFDTSTIFIYAFSPVYILARNPLADNADLRPPKKVGWIDYQRGGQLAFPALEGGDRRRND